MWVSFIHEEFIGLFFLSFFSSTHKPSSQKSIQSSLPSSPVSCFCTITRGGCLLPSSLSSFSLPGLMGDHQCHHQVRCCLQMRLLVVCCCCCTSLATSITTIDSPSSSPSSSCCRRFKRRLQLIFIRLRGGPIGGFWVAKARNASAIRWGWVEIMFFHPTVSMTSVACLQE